MSLVHLSRVRPVRRENSRERTDRNRLEPWETCPRHLKGAGTRSVFGRRGREVEVLTQRWRRGGRERRRRRERRDSARPLGSDHAESSDTAPTTPSNSRQYRGRSLNNTKHAAVAMLLSGANTCDAHGATQQHVSPAEFRWGRARSGPQWAWWVAGWGCCLCPSGPSWW